MYTNSSKMPSVSEQRTKFHPRSLYYHKKGRSSLLAISHLLQSAQITFSEDVQVTTSAGLLAVDVHYKPSAVQDIRNALTNALSIPMKSFMKAVKLTLRKLTGPDKDTYLFSVNEVLNDWILPLTSEEEYVILASSAYR